MRKTFVPTDYDRDQADLLKGITSYECEGTFRHQFPLDGAMCESQYRVDYRMVNGVTNILEQRTAVKGFTPSYTHSDGIRHTGIDPDDATLQFANRNVCVLFDVDASTKQSIRGAQSIAPDDGLIDYLTVGRPALGPRGVTAGASPTGAIQVEASGFRAILDPTQDQLAIDQEIRRPHDIRRRIQIVSTWPVGRHRFPKSVIVTDASLTGTWKSISRYEFDEPRLNGHPTLWQSALREGETVVDGHRVWTVDRQGRLQPVRSSVRHKSRDFTQALPFLGVAGLVVFGAALYLQRSKKRRS